MLAELRDADGRGLPRHVDRELAEYLRCGILAHGGGRRRVVAFVADAGQAQSLLVMLGLPADPATFAPARDPPQAELAWEDPA
jgi:hypothetical protein